MGLEKGKKKRISHCHFEKIAFYKKPDTILLVHFYLMKSGPDHLFSDRSMHHFLDRCCFL